MFIGKKLIYLELHKTGCSHVIKLLKAAPSCPGIVYRKHNTIYDVPPKLLGNVNSKIKAGNVRNPWDWYVSLWAFGCMGKGRLHGRLTSGLAKKLKKPWIFFIPAKKWEQVYADAHNPALFRQWLIMMLSESRKKDMGEGYGKTPLSAFAGLLTYRYLNLYTYDFYRVKKSIKTYEDMVAFDTQNNMLDITLENENLEDGLKQLMLKVNVPLTEIQGLLNVSKTNISDRENYQYYYDDETKELVRDKEKFIIEKYNYQY
jgi:hypothetical protein